MNEQTQQIIAALAEKLGTTAEHLWGVLVKQAFLNGLYNVSVIVLLVATTFWLPVFIKKLLKLSGEKTCPITPLLKIKF